jgi:hypothetical protein
MKHFYFLFVLAFLFAACGWAPQPGQTAEEPEKTELSKEEQGFLDNLSSLCGHSFRGQQTYMQEGRESWAHMDFVMHVTICEDGKVHIPFHLDEDQSRTWMFLAEEGRLRFRHDHRHPDGTPEDQTLYGGYADGTGTEFRQHFPADEYTIELLHDTLGRQWNVVLSEDMTNFSYQLQYGDELVFQADFDLTKPLDEEE